MSGKKMIEQHTKLSKTAIMRLKVMFPVENDVFICSSWICRNSDCNFHTRNESVQFNPYFYWKNAEYWSFPDCEDFK